MRRDISLYINNQRADLDNEAIIQFIYTMEDLTAPAVVKNSYSQQVTLKGTPTNNRIFGHLYRTDRVTGLGFNAMRKMPFEIYKNGSLLESGYVKVDNIECKGEVITYKVTLYGGLGSFLYALSYKADGEKMTLADLTYTSTPISYQITKEAVQEAWNALGTSYSKDNKWHTINFAPCYNGIPSEDFSADKAIDACYNKHYSLSTIESSNKYTTNNFVKLSKSYDEWQTKDLRSYMQRPVVRVRSIFEAIKDAAINGGYDVELDSTFFHTDNPYYNDAWVTLPILNTLELGEDSGTVAVSVSGGYLSSGNKSVIFCPTFNKSLEGATSSITLTCAVRAQLYSTPSDGESLSFESEYGEGASYRYTMTLHRYDGEQIGDAITKVAPTSFKYYASLNAALSTSNITFNVEGVEGLSYIKISGVMDTDIWTMIGSNVQQSYSVAQVSLVNDGTCEIAYTGYKTARSGSTITQGDLLRTEKTPADYILSYCKMFGLHFSFDKSARKVTIYSRNKWYQEAQHLNIAKRIDMSKARTITPYVFNAKWYDFKTEGIEAAFAEYYKTVYGKEYGEQIVNTGYDFGEEHNKVMESVLFKSAAEVKARGRYFNIIKQSGQLTPSVYLDGGHTVMYVEDGGTNSVDREITPVNASATITYLDEVFKSYDAESRLQFCDDENSPVDGENVLVLYDGKRDYYASLSDDTAEMLALNENTPCWVLNVPSAPLALPKFSRYNTSDKVVLYSLDFGTPLEVDIPDITLGESASIYSRAWSAYVADRYDADTKVLKCFVDWRGIEVGEALLRNFYYFDNAIWVLNKITNYSVTSYATTECEFVKVKSVANYQEGQEFE